MQRHILASGLLITGILVGIIGNIFFYEQALGLSVLIFALIVLILTVIWSSADNGLPSLRKIWIVIPILFFASMFVFRANGILLTFNGLAILALMALWLHYLNHEIDVDTASTQDHAQALIETTGHSLSGAGAEIEESYKWLKNQEWKNLSPLVAVGRGLLITIPVIIVFIVLFSSADAVFSERVTDFFGIFAFDNLEILATRFFLIIGIAWLVTGIFHSGMKSRSIKQDEQAFEADDMPEILTKSTPHPLRLGMTEATILLVSIVLLFGFFVFIQLTYFFAGEAAISEGLTYSAYARRGFFELLAVSVIVLGLMLILDNLTIRKNIRQQSIFLTLSVLMVGLTLVIMVSAWQRMVLYEQAYGFTHLRVYSHVFIVWLGILLAIGVLHLFRVRANIFAFGAILVAICYVGTLNLMNIDYYIAQQNIIRYENGEDLDVCYLRDLSVDALPPILELYNNTDDETVRDDLASWFLDKRRNETNRYHEASIFEYNTAHQSAYDTLTDMAFEPVENPLICGFYDDF